MLLSVLQGVLTCWVFDITKLFVGYFSAQMHRQLVTLSRFLRRCLFFSLYGEYVVRYFSFRMVVFYLVWGTLDFLHQLN